MTDARLDPPLLDADLRRARAARALAGRRGGTRRRRPRAATACSTSAAARCRRSRSSSPTSATYVGMDTGDNPQRRAPGRHRGDPGRRRVLRRRPLQPGAGARRRSGPGDPRALARDAPRGPGPALDPRRDGLPPVTRSTSGAGPPRVSTGCSGRTATGLPLRCPPAPARLLLAMLHAIYLEHVAPPDPLGAVRGPIVGLLNRAARALDRRVAQLRASGPGRSPRTTTSSRSEPREVRPLPGTGAAGACPQ